MRNLKSEIKGIIKKFLETNACDSKCTKNTWDLFKAVLKGSFISTNVHMKKKGGVERWLNS